MKKKNKLYAFAAVLVAALTMLFASPTETKAAEFSDRLVTEVCLGYNSYEESEEAKTYYLKNSHGDIIGQVDENGNLLASYSYNAFGELVAAVAFGPETSISSFLYAGEQYDAASGLYYLRARHYDVGIGRFTQEDTYLGDGRNLYAYTHSNPLKYTDPSGHASYSCLDDEADPFDERLNEIGGGVGNPVSTQGIGSTGRTTPNTLTEQMAMHQVQSNPLEGATQVPITMTDSRWPASDGWVKMQSEVQCSNNTKVTIHYNYNQLTDSYDDFKFK